MHNKMIAIGAIGLTVLATGWYLFRPELLFVNEKVNESFPTTQSSGQPSTLVSGSFHGVAHDTIGTATVHQIDGGKRVLRLTNFKTSNGPDVHLYLVGAMDAKDSKSVKDAGFIDLGKLKGNEGDQNYDLPANADLTKYQAVTVWCARFAVNFGTAPLTADKMAATAGPINLGEGAFHGVAHDTTGKATLYQVEGGKRVLRLTGFKTSNGPDVHVYLVAANDAKDSATVKSAGFIDVAKLKGNEGDQNYDLPANVDLAKYKSVSIWCARFGVNFGTAPLAAN
jgi:hypothetical protein